MQYAISWHNYAICHCALNNKNTAEAKTQLCSVTNIIQTYSARKNLIENAFAYNLQMISLHLDFSLKMEYDSYKLGHNFFLINWMQKTSTEIPYYYQEIIKTPEVFYSLTTSKTMFTLKSKFF